MNQYPALKIIASFLKIMSYIVPVLTVLAGLAYLSSVGGIGEGASFGRIFLYVLLAGLIWLIFSVYSELTILVVNIADDVHSLRKK